MKVLQIYNERRGSVSGELAVVNATARVLAAEGHESRLFIKSSKELDASIAKRVNAFWGGIYNVFAYREMRELAMEYHADLVHVHSVYPMFSPSVLVACRRLGIPVVMTVHNWFLTCPTWYHYRDGRVCLDCIGGREYNCVVHNCRKNILESVAYAARTAVGRRFRLFRDNLRTLIVMTPFGRDNLIQAGFRPDQIAIVANPASVRSPCAKTSAGEYVGFAGRVCDEKGIDIFVAAAARMPHILFKVAGEGPALADMKRKATDNVQFLGRLDADDLSQFYGRCRMLVVPSRCLEQFGIVAADAMMSGLPVIASNLGGLPYVVDESVTGLLFEPGNPEELQQKIERLWCDLELASRMGRAGQRKAMAEYTESAYSARLASVYERASGRAWALPRGDKEQAGHGL